MMPAPRLRWVTSDMIGFPVMGLVCAAWIAAMLWFAAPAVGGEQPITLKVVGGLAGVSQDQRLEKPFWEQRITEISHGRIRAEIHAFDRSGLPGQEMLQLMHLGVVPFGTALLAVVSADEPELNAVDLPGLNPDIAALRRTVGAYRGHLKSVLRSKFGIELLAIYAYPAQVIFCSRPFSGLGDLAGRRIRTSSVGQSEMMAALGAVPAVIPFADVVKAVRAGTVDCAITGTLSGLEIGLTEVTSYISPMAISWGLSLFGANAAAFQALPADVQTTIKGAVAGLEHEIWDAAEQETEEGLRCDIGAAECRSHQAGHMKLVPLTAQDEARRRQLLVSAVLPGWIQRCGPDCATAWNATLAPLLGIRANPK